MINNFEDFLKAEIIKSEINLKDNGFSDMVISNLPKQKVLPINRNFILLSSSLIAFLVFIFLNGKVLINGLYHFLFSLLNYGTLNSEFILITLLFSGILLSIPALEFKRRVF